MTSFPLIFVLLVVSVITASECGYDPEQENDPLRKMESDVDFRPAWSPDGDFIITYADYGLHGVTTDGTRHWDISRKRKDFQTAPDISRNGILAFRHLMGKGDERAWHITLAEAGVDRTRDVSSIKSQSPIAWPIWSPDGRFAAEEWYDRPHWGVRVLDPHGEQIEMVRLGLPPPGWDEILWIRVVQTAWSPDSTQVAILVHAGFTTEPGYRDECGLSAKMGSGLFVASTNNWTPRPVVRTIDENITSVAWHPDGNRLFYVLEPRSVYSSAPACGNETHTLQSIQPDGSDQRLLATLDKDARYVGTPPWRSGGPMHEEVQISSDGKAMLLARTILVYYEPNQYYRGGRTSIHLFDADGSELELLMHNEDDAVYASWSPDGARLAIATPHHERVLLYTMRPDGSDARVLLERNERGKIKTGQGRPLTDE